MSGVFPTPYFALDDKKSPSTVLEWQRQMRDQITGQLSKSVAGNVDVNLTTDESYKHTIILTGALTGNINVILTPLTKQWVITNSTSGAFTLTVKTKSGTGVTIAQGKSAIVYSDGTNIVRATPDT